MIALTSCLIWVSRRHQNIQEDEKKRLADEMLQIAYVDKVNLEHCQSTQLRSP